MNMVSGDNIEVANTTILKSIYKTTFQSKLEIQST